ncbi:SOS response-associated peptidase [Dermabacter vaginalis]|uniref:Abasic site processing protein n=2 Tax=Dermabacter vaginalis TaxID=1630135 RepID=A0ABX6A4H8_9MICO|nr:SOS response-associated peptidase [Dermabacter vaginalis]
MCGRFAFFQEIEPMLDDLGALDLADPHLHARYNIPPTAPIYVVTEGLERATGELRRGVRTARWGLLPRFAKDLSFSAKTFNARRESLVEKPSFRGSLERYRALVPMNGYFEWQAGTHGKVPHFIHGRDTPLLYAAGLVSWWKNPADPEATWLLSATIITKAAEGHLKHIHSRMPVFLDPNGRETWLSLDSFSSGAEAHAWVGGTEGKLASAALEAYPVGREVGSAANEGPHLLERQSPTPT